MLDKRLDSAIMGVIEYEVI